MVTHQQPDIETPTPTPTPPRRRSRRGSWLAFGIAVALVVVGVGIAYAMDAFDSEADAAAGRLAVATELVDTWNQGWQDHDPETVMSVFTDDGVYIESDGTTYTMDLMKTYVSSNSYLMGNVDRIGELTPGGEETYTSVGEFEWGGIRFGGELEIELEGDLAARIEWLSDFDRIGPASDS